MVMVIFIFMVSSIGWIVNNKSINFKELITVDIRTFCVVRNLSDKIYSFFAPRFRLIISDKRDHQGKKDVTNDTDTPNHKSRAAAS